jgi:hypothetical protein
MLKQCSNEPRNYHKLVTLIIPEVEIKECCSIIPAHHFFEDGLVVSGKA